MDNINAVYSIILAIITLLGSAAAWRYYDARAEERRSDNNFIKKDFKERIDKLELLLERSSDEKDELRNNILELTRQVSELKVKVDFLETENAKLKRMA